MDFFWLLVAMGCLIVLTLIIYNVIQRCWLFATKNKSQKASGFLTMMLPELTVMALSWFFVVSLIPSFIPTYTLSNGKQTIVYQSMIHVGNLPFYQRIDKNVRQMRDNGFTVFREGLGSSGALTETHPECAMKAPYNLLQGMEQPDCLGGYFKGDIYADMTGPQFKAAIARYAADDGLTDERVDALIKEEVESLYQLTNDRSSSFRYYLNKPNYIAMSIKLFFYHGIVPQGKSEGVDRVILDERNKVLANAIIQSNSDKNYVTYGFLHFNGALALLKKHDPTWKVTDVSYTRFF